MQALELGLGCLAAVASGPRLVFSAPAKDEDRALIERIKQGDRRAFDALFHRHADDVHRWLTRLVGPVSEREDMVQEVFIAAFKGIDRFRGEAAFSTWLYRIVAHVAYAHLRRRKRAPVPLELEDLPPPSPDSSPETLAEHREQLQQIMRALDSLKPKKRIAFVLRVVEGLSLEEIGQIVGARPAAVGQRVRHARMELDAILTKREARSAL